MFEFEKFASGTRSAMDAMVEATQQGVVTVIGGGDTATAAANWGKVDQVDISAHALGFFISYF